MRPRPTSVRTCLRIRVGGWGLGLGVGVGLGNLGLGFGSGPSQLARNTDNEMATDAFHYGWDRVGYYLGGVSAVLRGSG